MYLPTEFINTSRLHIRIKSRIQTVLRQYIFHRMTCSNCVSRNHYIQVERTYPRELASRKRAAHAAARVQSFQIRVSDFNSQFPTQYPLIVCRQLSTMSSVCHLHCDISSVL